MGSLRRGSIRRTHSAAPNTPRFRSSVGSTTFPELLGVEAPDLIQKLARNRDDRLWRAYKPERNRALYSSVTVTVFFIIKLSDKAKFGIRTRTSYTVHVSSAAVACPTFRV